MSVSRWIALSICVGFLLWSLRPGRTGTGMMVPIRGMAPSWTMTNLQGQAVSSTAFAGKIQVINFWATWCPPCRAEIPDLIEFTKNHSTNDVVVIGASVDADGAASVMPFSKRIGINYENLIAPIEIGEAFGSVSMLPTTFIVNTNGQFAFRYIGPISAKELTKMVSVLRGNQP